MRKMQSRKARLHEFIWLKKTQYVTCPRSGGGTVRASSSDALGSDPTRPINMALFPQSLKAPHSWEHPWIFEMSEGVAITKKQVLLNYLDI